MPPKHLPLLGHYLTRAIARFETATTQEHFIEVIRTVAPLTLTLSKLLPSDTPNPDLEDRYIAIANAINSEEAIRQLDPADRHMLQARTDETTRILLIQTTDSLERALDMEIITIDLDNTLRDCLAPGSPWITNYGPIADAPRRR